MALQNRHGRREQAWWYWALCQAVQVHNYIPCSVEGISTTPHELIYGIKPDLCVLFQMFSTGFFRNYWMDLIIAVMWQSQRACRE
jgi:hypothetical protein